MGIKFLRQMTLLTKSPLGLTIALCVLFTDSVYPICYLHIHLHNYTVFSIRCVSFSDINLVVNSLLVSVYQFDKAIALKLLLISHRRDINHCRTYHCTWTISVIMEHFDDVSFTERFLESECYLQNRNCTLSKHIIRGFFHKK